MTKKKKKNSKCAEPKVGTIRRACSPKMTHHGATVEVVAEGFAEHTSKVQFMHDCGDIPAGTEMFMGWSELEQELPPRGWSDCRDFFIFQQGEFECLVGDANGFWSADLHRVEQDAYLGGKNFESEEEAWQFMRDVSGANVQIKDLAA